MNILLIGKGGRENCLAWKLNKSKLVTKIYIAPGNAGTLQFGINLPINIKKFDEVIKACIDYNINMVVIGPEEPLVDGLFDAIRNNKNTKNIKIIGPSKIAAQLEGSKAFAKQFMLRNNIPTAAYKEFNKDNFDEGVNYLKNHSLPIVLKADGLAAGKGVIICHNHLEAIAEFELMIHFSKFGEAGNKVVIEEFLKGDEFSVFVITDGKNYKILPIAKDYKRIGEGGIGLNTGGMGAISPVPYVDNTLFTKVVERIIKPTIQGLDKENFEYCGFVFFGLINVNGEPFVIEYNCRLGDPETQVVLPRLKNDLADIFIKLCNNELDKVVIEKDEQFAVTIVAASGGYPEAHEIGYKIEGIKNETDSTIFMSSVIFENEEYITDGGRILAVTSMADDFITAIEKSKTTLANIHFEDMYYRRDIGAEFIK